MRPRRDLIIEPYLGYGTGSKVVVSGRVLREKTAVLSTKTDTRWRNLANTFRRFATAEVGGARVRARFGRSEANALTDTEGYFTIEIAGRPEEPRLWHELELALEASEPRTATAEVLVPPATARFGVISDIDDTVVSTHVTSTLKMLATVLLSNAHVRTPFPGIAAFYRALQGGATGAEGNPIFYVSNGPWNFYGLLLEFFRLNDIPLGPLFLRDFGAGLLFSPDARRGQKLFHVEKLLQDYAELPFVLIGDSGERDPEIYAEVVKRHPRRIKAIYIRSVDRRPRRLAAIDALAETLRPTDTQFVLAQDSAFAAVHAAGEGLIATRALPEIRGEASA
jgi:phosphatidate phosphatase APP1